MIFHTRPADIGGIPAASDGDITTHPARVIHECQMVCSVSLAAETCNTPLEQCQELGWTCVALEGRHSGNGIQRLKVSSHG